MIKLYSHGDNNEWMIGGLWVTLHVPEWAYWQHMRMDALELLQRWHGQIWLSMTPPVSMRTAAEEGTLTTPTQVSNKVRLYTCLVCRNHRPWWHDPLAPCYRIGGAEYVSSRACVQVPNGVEQQGPKKKRTFPLACMRAGAAGVKLCKAGSGWRLKSRLARVHESEAGWGQTAKWYPSTLPRYIMPQFEGTHTWRPLIHVGLDVSLSLSYFLFLSLFFFLFFFFFLSSSFFLARQN